MDEGRFTTLTAATLTADQKRVAEAIQSGPRGAGRRGPFNALLRSPELCDLVQRVGAFVRFGTSIPARVNELAIEAGVTAAFGERGVVDLMSAVGDYSLVAMVLNVARVPLPAGVEPPLK